MCLLAFCRNTSLFFSAEVWDLPGFSFGNSQCCPLNLDLHSERRKEFLKSRKATAKADCWKKGRNLSAESQDSRSVCVFGSFGGSNLPWNILGVNITEGYLFSCNSWFSCNSTHWEVHVALLLEVSWIVWCSFLTLILVLAPFWLRVFS